MIERVARAIATAMYGKPREPKNYQREIARAAIAAMREPTEAMVDATAEKGPTQALSAAIWQAMIDAALEEGN